MMKFVLFILLMLLSNNTVFSQLNYADPNQKLGVAISGGLASSKNSSAHGFAFAFMPSKTIELGVSYASGTVRYREDGRTRRDELNTTSFHVGIVGERNSINSVILEFSMSYLIYDGDEKIPGKHIPLALSVTRDIKVPQNPIFGNHLTLFPEFSILKVISFDVPKQDEALTFGFDLGMVFNRNDSNPMFFLTPGISFYRNTSTISVTAGFLIGVK